MAYQFTTTLTFPNPYIACMVNNINLIKTLNHEKKDWTRKYHKIIWELETMANIQLKFQEIVKLTNTTNIELADIETVLLQPSNIYKKQIREDIYSIMDNLWNILHGDIEKRVHYIQTLLADELDQCKKKEDE